jgi:hypothetical protein
VNSIKDSGDAVFHDMKYPGYIETVSVSMFSGYSYLHLLYGLMVSLLTGVSEALQHQPFPIPEDFQV